MGLCAAGAHLLELIPQRFDLPFQGSFELRLVVQVL
jgi:hypothetical protein